MKNYAHIASRVLNTPLLLEPSYARTFFSALSTQLNINSLVDAEGTQLTGEKIRMPAASFSKGRDRERPYEIVDGVAVVPVSGSLTHKLGSLRPYSGMTGYDGIIAQVSLAMGDPEVKGVFLDCDTPGGEVAGCFDTARQLRDMANQAGKPLWSLAYDMHCSAGMALASASSRRLITQTGVAGSVGVVMAHADQSQHMQEQGIKVTLIHSGAHKVDGNPYQSLSKDALASFQASTDQLRLEFAQLVADHIGLSVDAVLATEAQVYRGQEAVDVGFADSVVNGHEAIAEFSNYLSSEGRTISLGVTMSKQQTDTNASNDSPAPGVQMSEQAAADTTYQAQAQAQTEERERIQAIVCHAESAGRKKLADHLAFGTSMSVADAGKVLAAAEKESTVQLDATSSLDTLMNAEEQPNLSSDVDDSTDTTIDLVAEGTAAYRSMKGIK